MYNSLIIQKKMVKKDRNFNLGEIISRAQSASTTKRKEMSCFWCKSLQVISETKMYIWYQYQHKTFFFDEFFFLIIKSSQVARTHTRE